MTWVRPLPPPSEARIRRIEESWQVRLPPAYRQFLRYANGARLPDGDLAPDGGLVIERFLPILDDYTTHPDGWADVEVVTSQLDSRLTADPDATGIGLLPIAALFGGDMLALDYLRPGDEPAVSRWHHEESDDFRPVTDVVAADFASFLRSIDR